MNAGEKREKRKRNATSNNNKKEKPENTFRINAKKNAEKPEYTCLEKPERRPTPS